MDPWVEAGIPAQAILKAMTTEAHRLLGLDAVRGSIKVGQAADLIATSDRARRWHSQSGNMEIHLDAPSIAESSSSRTSWPPALACWSYSRRRIV